jgi:YidC/Oxa1 family membrane protein insertase
MEKRLVLFLIISFAIVFAYPFILQHIAPSLLTQKKADEKTRSKPRGETFAPIATEFKPHGQPEGERNIVVETDLYKATFSNRGGTLVSWKLKQYKDEKEKNKTAEEEIELIPQQQKGVMPPLSVVSDGEDETDRLYQIEGKDINLQGGSGSEKGKILFIYEDIQKKERITKEYSFEKGTYLLGLDVQVSGVPKGYTLFLGTNTGIHDWGKSFGGLVGPIFIVNNKKESENPKKMPPEVTRSGLIKWAAQQDKYFLAAILPKEPLEGAIELLRTSETQVNSGIKIPPPDVDKIRQFEIYLGPKEYKRLQALHKGLEDTIDFGWFIFGSWWLVRMIAKPLFYILKFFYTFSHNYGVSIILVTCLVKGLFFPISLKGVKSMRSMQQIQPKLAALRKKYENDREKLNKEMIELYKKHNINPLGGCLPMLIQLPVFVALFNVLYVSIEMRQAPFVFWIHDLSSSDPYYILPLLYGGTTFLLQKLQPSGMDPQQAKMTAIFIPIVTTVLFLNFPSGLVLYWVINNLLSIGQQRLMGPVGQSPAQSG